MPSTHKKVIVRKHDRDSISGYVAPANFVVDGKLELLNTSGQVVAIDLRDIKAVYFVREFSDTDLMLRKTFTTRPRTEGLWVRMKFKDSEVLEGILPNDLTQNPAEGFLMNPPDLRSNTQRVFVPREAPSLCNRVSSNRRRQPETQRRCTGHPAGNVVRTIGEARIGGRRGLRRGTCPHMPSRAQLSNRRRSVQLWHR